MNNIERSLINWMGLDKWDKNSKWLIVKIKITIKLLLK
jgi:hypothetical protein